MLTINRVITLPTLSSGYSELYCRSGARSVASRKSGGAERSGAASGSCRKTMELSAEQEVTGSGGYRNMLERGVWFSLLT